MGNYIRTKDTIFEVVKEDEKIFVVKAKGNKNHLYNKSKCQTTVAKQANTIEELCDEFVIFNSNDICVGIIDNYETAKHKSPYKSVIYGAIWTDKGLIYVAKMNDKGELELL